MTPVNLFWDSKILLVRNKKFWTNTRYQCYLLFCLIKSNASLDAEIKQACGMVYILTHSYIPKFYQSIGELCVFKHTYFFSALLCMQLRMSVVVIVTEVLIHPSKPRPLLCLSWTEKNSCFSAMSTSVHLWRMLWSTVNQHEQMPNVHWGNYATSSTI